MPSFLTRPTDRSPVSLSQTCPEVTVAAALLIDSQLWGFVTPANVDVKEVLAAAAKVQPYYAVPTQILALDQFPTTG